MKFFQQIIIGFIVTFSIVVSCIANDELTVDEIVARANHAALYHGDDCKGTLTLVITDKQGRERKRELNVLRKDVDSTDQDQKYFTYFISPSDVRKMVFMVHKHATIGMDDDRWLYMPGLDLVKRIAASDKRTSFVGSDFLYEDISGRSPYEDRHELIDQTADCFIIKNIPEDPGSVEFAYYIACIDRKTFIPIKTEYFKDNDRLYREIKVVTVEDIPASEYDKSIIYPTVTKSVVYNLDTGSKTEMIFSNIQYNCGLKENLFSERYLRKPPRQAIR